MSETMKVRVNEDIPSGFYGYASRGKIIEVERELTPLGHHRIINEGGGVIQPTHFTIVPDGFQPESGMVFETVSGSYGIFVQVHGEWFILGLVNLNGDHTWYNKFDPEVNLKYYNSYATRLTKIIKVRDALYLLPSYLKRTLTENIGEVVWEYAPPQPKSVTLDIADNDESVVITAESVDIGEHTLTVAELRKILDEVNKLRNDH